MKIIIQGKQFRVTEAMKRCHLTLRMPGARAIQVEKTTNDAYASLDAAAGRLVRAAKRSLSRMRRPKGRRKEPPLATVVAEGGIPGGLLEDLPNAAALAAATPPMSRSRRAP